MRLGVDHVDVLQIHDLDRTTPIEESWGELQRLREEERSAGPGSRTIPPSWSSALMPWRR